MHCIAYGGCSCGRLTTKEIQKTLDCYINAANMTFQKYRCFLKTPLIPSTLCAINSCESIHSKAVYHGLGRVIFFSNCAAGCPCNSFAAKSQGHWPSSQKSWWQQLPPSGNSCLPLAAALHKKRWLRAQGRYLSTTTENMINLHLKHNTVMRSSSIPVSDMAALSLSISMSTLTFRFVKYLFIWMWNKPINMAASQTYNKLTALTLPP